MHIVSVVVPCRNARGTIGGCLEALGRQTLKPDEVIVVDGASDDGSAEAAARYPVTVIRSPRPLSAGEARNLGLARAGGEIVAFTDADAVPRYDWVHNIIGAFGRWPGAAGVGGRILDGSRGVAGKLEYLSNFSEFALPRAAGPVPTIPTLNVAYRRDAIRGIEFIPTTAGEDTMFNAELAGRGRTLVFDPSITVTHAPAREGLRDFFRNQYRCGVAFVHPRVRFPMRGNVLLRHPALLLCLPRLAVLFRRYLFTRHIASFIVFLPLLAAGEACRTAGILAQRRAEGQAAWRK
ncbi:MAG: glycosyltransferase [Chlamydiota bacterium]